MRGFKDSTKTQYARGGDVKSAPMSRPSNMESSKRKHLIPSPANYGDEALIQMRKKTAPAKPSKPADPLHGTNGYKRGGKVVEKGTGERYASKAAMAKHEAKESKAYERKEHRKQMGGPVYAQDAQMLANDAAGLKAMAGYRKGGKVPC